MTKKVGLALGAGSTKGFAHIGVLQVFEEHGIPVDLLAGSSIGSIVGAIYAVGTNLNMLEKFALSINMREYIDLANPLNGGFLRGDRLQELVRLFTHDKTFLETRIPFCCVAVDEVRGELVTLHTGKLHESVRASMSIPGIFQPVRLHGRTLIDGGVLERVPCRALIDMGADVVIGVDVGYRGGRAESDSGNAYYQIDRTIDIMQWEITKLRTEIADVMIVPEVLFVRGHFDTAEAAACIEEGRRAARAAMPEILELLKKNGIPLRG